MLPTSVGFRLIMVHLVLVPPGSPSPTRAEQLRGYHYTQAHGYLSFGGFTTKNDTDTWERADFTGKFLDTLYSTAPAVLLTLVLASCMAFVLTRFSIKLNALPLLIVLSSCTVISSPA
jgi:multiple sugar transport system permease protein